MLLSLLLLTLLLLLLFVLVYQFAASNSRSGQHRRLRKHLLGVRAPLFSTLTALTLSLSLSDCWWRARQVRNSVQHTWRRRRRVYLLFLRFELCSSCSPKIADSPPGVRVAGANRIKASTRIMHASGQGTTHMVSTCVSWIWSR